MKVGEAKELLDDFPDDADLYLWITTKGYRVMCTPESFSLNPSQTGVGINLKQLISMKDES